MKVTMMFDGACSVARGIAAGGAVVYDEKGAELAARGVFLRGRTTPEAEYAGLITGLEVALELGATHIICLGDAELIVRQVDGRYACRKPHLKVLLDRVIRLGGQFELATIRELPKAGPKMKRRHGNVRADALAGMAMDAGHDIIVVGESVLPWNRMETQNA